MQNEHLLDRELQDRGSDAPILNVHVAEKSFGSTRILHDVVFDVSLGDTLAITGPSGCGKSTLLRLIAGLDRDFSGTIQAPDLIGFVFQEPTLLPWATALGNLTIACNIPHSAARDALGQVGLSHVGDQYPAQMSLGQQRRLALARAFAIRPKLLLMDEAFVSLDAALAEEMFSLFETLRASYPVATVLVTHDMTEATRLSSQIYTLGAS